MKATLGLKHVRQQYLKTEGTLIKFAVVFEDQWKLVTKFFCWTINITVASGLCCGTVQ